MWKVVDLTVRLVSVRNKIQGVLEQVVHYYAPQDEKQNEYLEIQLPSF